jgi:hypothetical protein
LCHHLLNGITARAGVGDVHAPEVCGATAGAQMVDCLLTSGLVDVEDDGGCTAGGELACGRLANS